MPCPRCGFGNEPGWTRCANCRARSPTGPPSSGTPPSAKGPLPRETARRRQIDRTKSGVLALLVGALLSWIPLTLVRAIGGLLTLIGAILVILGRKAFGTAHRRSVLVSIVLFCVGLAIAVIGAVLILVVAVGEVQMNPGMSEAQLGVLLGNAFTNLLIIAAAGSFVGGFASVFFTYALQRTEGRVVLWAAYGATVGVQIAILVVTLPLVPTLAAQVAHEIVTTGTVDSAEISDAVDGASAWLPLLNVVPALLSAAANYLAWRRIDRGETPVPPPVPTPAPPAPPTAPPINPV